MLPFQPPFFVKKKYTVGPLGTIAKNWMQFRDKINSAAAFIFKLFYVSRINYILHLHIKTSHKKLRCCAFLKVSAAFAANMGLHFFTNDTFAKLKQIIFLLHARFNF